ncbi:MAG: RNA polymerase sigma-70 factor [Bacteroidota bacterium]
MQQSTSDLELLDQLRAGKSEALDALFRRHYVGCCQTADRIVRDHAAAEDVVQELFLWLWNKRSTLPVMQEPKAYLNRAARNRALNWLRDRARIPDSDGEIPEIPTNASQPIDQLELEELQKRVDAAIDSLPERCRLIYVLCRIEEMPRVEVAQQLGISLKTVENQMTRAYRFLREYLSLVLLLTVTISF